MRKPSPSLAEIGQNLNVMTKWAPLEELTYTVLTSRRWKPTRLRAGRERLLYIQYKRGRSRSNAGAEAGRACGGKFGSGALAGGDGHAQAAMRALFSSSPPSHVGNGLVGQRNLCTSVKKLAFAHMTAEELAPCR
eukprot:5849437-Pleurochrysis_carterae.AAC.1